MNKILNYTKHMILGLFGIFVDLVWFKAPDMHCYVSLNEYGDWVMWHTGRWHTESDLLYLLTDPNGINSKGLSEDLQQMLIDLRRGVIKIKMKVCA